MKRKFHPKEATQLQKIEVKIGSGALIVEESELDNLIEALTEMRKLATGGRALMNIGSS
jgi:hypothetical protein